MSTPNESDALAGMAWWNGLTEAERVEWMDLAGNTGVAADAWEAFKNYDPTPWCSGCGARRERDCHCGPIAENN